MTDKLNQFIIDIQGQFVEISDRTNIYQCYDLAALWVLVLGIPKSTISHLYAYEIYTKPNANTTQYFDLIPNTATFIPQDGDIAVFDKSTGNVAGHVGVALGGGTINSFMLFNQNNPLGTSAHLASYNYNSPKLLGVLRAKITPPSNPEITSSTRIPAVLISTPEFPVNDFKEVQAIKSDLQALAKDIVNLQGKIEKAKTDLS